MAKRLLVVDSGGTTRLVKAGRFFVVDSGGTTRKIKRLFVVDAGGTARQVYQATTLETTITVGNDGIVVFYGWNSTLYGSIGSATYTDSGGNSRTLTAVLWEAVASGAVRLTMSAAGIPNTDNTFATISINGVTFARSAATYDGAASGGTRSSWLWSAVDSFACGTGGSVPFVVS